MPDIHIEIDSGASKRLLTAGKYCKSDIVVTCSGGGESGSELADSIVNRTIDRIVSNVSGQIGMSAFAQCQQLEYAEFKNYVQIKATAFSLCGSLKTLIFRADEVCPLLVTTAFSKSAIENKTGYVYVPKTIVEQYKEATNWSTYASQIRAIEDYPEITGGAS